MKRIGEGGVMLRLVPMTEVEYARYLSTAVRSYAQSHVEAGDVLPEEAMARAQADYDELLPRGLASPNQFLYTLHDDALGEIGMIWFAVREHRQAKSAYLYDFFVREGVRRMGHGRRALELLEARLRELGIGRIGLNVFGHNHAARALYERMGYRITGIGMVKVLAGQDA